MSLRTFLYLITASLLVSVSATAAVPSTQNISITTDENIPVSVTLRATDTDRRDTLVFTYSAPVHGELTYQSTGRRFEILTYTPDDDFFGNDSFTFYVTDRTGNVSNTATVSITVSGINDAPVASDVSVSTRHSASVSISLSGTDSDSPALTWQVLSSPSHGTLGELNGNQITYTPSITYMGSDSFTFAVSDGEATSTAATVSIDVTSSKSETVSLQHAQTFLLNQLTGLTEDGANALKLQHACQNGGPLVGVGILTPNLALHDGGSLRMVETGLQDYFSYKHVYCGAHTAYVVTQTQVARVDLDAHVTTTLADFSGDGEEIYYLNGMYDEKFDRLFITFLESQSILVLDGPSLEVLAALSLGRSDIYVQDNGDILAVNTSGDRSVKAFDGSSYELKSSLTLSYTITSSAYNPETHELWWYNSGQGQAKVLDLDTPVGSRLVSIAGIIPEASVIDYSQGHIVISCENCYDSGVDGEKRGGVSVIDAQSKTLLYNLDLVHEHKQMMMDEVTGEVILANNNEMSVTRLEPLSGESQVIDLGNGFEWLTVDARSQVHLVNRLGGSSITSLDPATGGVTTLSTLPWPVGAAYDSASDQVVTFHHFGNSFGYYEIDDATLALTSLEAVSFAGVMNEPEHDALGHITYDTQNAVAYAAIPENNQVAIAFADGTTRVLDLLDYLGGTGYDELKGAGHLTLASYDKEQWLFVYIRATGTVWIYDGKQDYALMGSLVQTTSSFYFPNSIRVLGDRFYLNQDIYELPTLSLNGRLRYGDISIAQDPDADILLTMGIDTASATEVLYILSSDGQTLLDQIEVNSSNTDIRSAVVYDERLGWVYVLSMESAVLKRFTVFE